MSSIRYKSGLTDRHKSLIRRGALNGDRWEAIHKKASAISPVTQSLVKKMIEEYASEVAIKSSAKKEGSRILNKFLEKALKGNDVNDMSTAIEQALYQDILRRYTEVGDALVSMTMEQVLKLEMSYRKARLAENKRATDLKDSDQISKLSARICLTVIEKLGSLTDVNIKSQLEKVEKPLIEWAAHEFGKENITEILNERSEIERLADFIGEKRANHNGQKPPAGQKLVGLVG